MVVRYYGDFGLSVFVDRKCVIDLVNLDLGFRLNTFYFCLLDLVGLEDGRLFFGVLFRVKI